MAEILALTCLFCAPVLHTSNEENTFLFHLILLTFSKLWQCQYIYNTYKWDSALWIISSNLHDKMSKKNKTPRWLTLI